MKARKMFAALGVVLLTGIVLAGCRSEEQGRITQYQPGVYLGKPDQALNAEQVRTLRHRALMQSGTIKPTGGGGGVKSTRDVRKPGASAIDYGKLNHRGRNQKGS